MTAKQNKKRIPLTRFVVMITACVVTFIGIVVGLEPDVILLRCAAACALTGVVSHICSLVLIAIVPPTQNEN